MSAPALQIRRNPLGVTLVGFIAALTAADLTADLRAGLPSSHVLWELVCASGLAMGVAFLAARARRSQEETRRLASELSAAQADARHCAATRPASPPCTLVRVESRFETWGLTTAEREVGLLLLRGLRHKEIASARSTSERTVRQQALAIYRKAGVEGKTELAAHFLGDLSAPLPHSRSAEEDPSAV